MNLFFERRTMNAERAYTLLDARPGLTPSQLKKKYLRY